MTIKQRKLYQVRHHPGVIGRAVGHKARLLPRHAALRVARRLRQGGLFITVEPLTVNLTPAQAEHLQRRYA